MGRYIKRTKIVNWKNNNYINRRAEYLIKMSKKQTLRTIISYINPLLWGISKIEYHSYNNNNLIIITGTKSSELNHIKNIIQSIPNYYIPKLILQELPYNYLDPLILAKSIAGKKNKEILRGDINFNSENSMINAPIFQLTSIDNHSSQVINGIRIEIKGITGKMTMSKKIIKTFGTLKLSCHNSIIDFGIAKKKGIGVKVWISSNNNK